MKHYLKITISCAIAVFIALLLMLVLPDPFGGINIWAIFKAQYEILVRKSTVPQFSHILLNKYSSELAVIGLFVEFAITVLFVWKREQVMNFCKKVGKQLFTLVFETEFLNPYIKFTILFSIGLYLMFCIYERNLRTSGFYPGMGFGYVTCNGFRHVDSVKTLQYHIADSAGMVYFDRNVKYYTDNLHKVNIQGFLAGFDYSRLVVDSLRKEKKKLFSL